MTLYEQVAEYIHREGLLGQGETLLAAVSGGADSVALLDCLLHLGYRVTVAHLDHGMRPESGSDAEFVGRLAERYGVHAVIGKEDVPGAARRGGSLEETARRLRYRFLARVCQREGIETIATGHTVDDQAETILMHFLRGAGPEGLRGMQPITPLSGWLGSEAFAGLRLVRPLLAVSRSQTEAHCRAIGVKPLWDASNEDPAFTRNRIRLDLLPALETFNPRLRKSLLRLGAVMREDAALLRELAAEAFSHTVIRRGEGVCSVTNEHFSALHPAIQRRLIRLMVAAARPQGRDFGFEAVERARAFLLGSRAGRRMSLPLALELLQEGKWAIMRVQGAAVEWPEYPQMPGEEELRLKPPGEVDLAHGWRLTAEVAQRYAAEASPEAHRRTAVLFARGAQEVVTIRPRRPGDRMQPQGMAGRVKLSDLFINERIPRTARERWPVILWGGSIGWVPGLRQAETAGATQREVQRLILRLLPPEGERKT